MFAFIKAFIAGFISTLTFHQGLLWLLHVAGLVGSSAWAMAPVPPLGVPDVISLAFWGGLWGMLIWLLIRHTMAAGYYVGALILGAILPTLMFLSVVPLVKGENMADIAAAWTLPHIAVGLALNGIWGLGVALLMRVMQPVR